MFNQVTRAALLAAGIDGTLILKWHGFDDGDGERDGEGLLEGLLERLLEGLGNGIGSIVNEGPPALETEKLSRLN